MIKIKLTDLKVKAKRRPEGYYDEVISLAEEVTDTHVVLTTEKFHELAHKYRSEQVAPKEEPSLLDLVTNFAGSVSNWAKAGFPVTSEEEYNTRMAICKGCPYWKENILSIDTLGKCKLCGCRGFKPWLKTEVCPVSNW